MKEKKEKWLYDIESFRNFFCVGLKNLDSKEVLYFEISERKDDRKLIYNWFSKYKGFLISFNGTHYDNTVIHYFLKNWKALSFFHELDACSELKEFSDKVINQDSYFDEIKIYKYYPHKWTDIDLFMYWSKMLRVSKKLSLKALAVQLGYPVIQELPFEHNKVLELTDLDKLKHYNTVHDIGILELLTERMRNDIVLRQSVNKDYKLNCWSWDAIKIASEALLIDYCKLTNQKEDVVRNKRFISSNFYLRDILTGFNPQFKLPIFQKLFERICNSYNTFEESLIIDINNTRIRLDYGQGGLHAKNENEKYYSTDTHQIKTSDVASLYPTLIINFRTIRFPEVLQRYIEIKAERLIAKKAKLKIKDTFFKLILNGISGLLDNPHSWLYFHEGAMRLRLIGQLILTKVVEVCIINNWQVISCNTDGIEVIIPKGNDEQYALALKEVEQQFNLELEHENYKSIVYSNVSSYIAITESGKVKRKGFFKLAKNENGDNEIPLGDSTNELVIPICLNLFYTKNISPEEVLKNPEKYDLHIYDFCRSNKISKDYKVYWKGKLQQQLNRYYVSKGAPYLYKRKKGKQVDENVLVGWGVQLYNEHIEKPLEEYNIDYRYYASKVNKIISELNKNNQLSLF